ncbi:Hypothetical_protein [Hexamita inflata]|uniref:Hypothetical_protein n=1 Tax=Hexamita inflata TaxID=28002 RepID=A0AA86NYE0_9EUKA|nr:Hypothetical protein HINF_LOCUS3067 [Hexamita inflata]CAI9928882.1 Hypothetical protein HINF_LOCUS16527 [Hexamita inflata]CAI9942869.1 Hypothetical protein HINF_LOCUS30514 [Hexamita inflata]
MGCTDQFALSQKPPAVEYSQPYTLLDLQKYALEQYKIHPVVVQNVYKYAYLDMNLIKAQVRLFSELQSQLITSVKIEQKIRRQNSIVSLQAKIKNEAKIDQLKAMTEDINEFFTCKPSTKISEQEYISFDVIFQNMSLLQDQRWILYTLFKETLDNSLQKHFGLELGLFSSIIDGTQISPRNFIKILQKIDQLKHYDEISVLKPEDKAQELAEQLLEDYIRE